MKFKMTPMEKKWVLYEMCIRDRFSPAAEQIRILRKLGKMRKLSCVQSYLVLK